MKFEKTAFFNDLSSRFTPTLSSNINSLLEHFNAKLEICIPAIVIYVDREKSIVKVKLAPNVIYPTGETQERGIIEVPILISSGGGFMINFPIKEGDVGWVIAGDRDTTGYREDNSKTYDLLSIGTHMYSYGFFIPDVFSNIDKTFKLEEEDAGKLVIQTLNGSTKIRLSHDGVIDIICPTTLNITGNVNVNGTITATGDVIGEGVSLAHHTHPCGGETTGKPNK